MPSSTGSTPSPPVDHEATIKSELKRYQPLRKHRYAAVTVLVLTWKAGDPNFAKDAADIAQMFKTSFNYNICHYEIPSDNSQASLNLRVSQCIQYFGAEDNLIIVYYGGHGGPSAVEDTTYTWAAQNVGGPTLDWSIIQPQFLGAKCDVVILLDCCYAGQAVRARCAHSVEVLAAADKDLWTPVGTAKWPSFTRVLIREMKSLLDSTGAVTLLDVHKRMIGAKAGLLRQPFYASITPESHSKGSRLVRWSPVSENTEIFSLDSMENKREEAFLHMRVRLENPLDDPTTTTFIKWVTKEAPSFIEDIEFDQIVSNAQVAGSMASQLMRPDPNSPPSMLPEETRKELLERTQALNDSIILPDVETSNRLELYKVLGNIKQSSEALIAFTENCLTSVSPQALSKIKDRDLSAMKDLRGRISMRLLLLNGQDDARPIRVSFNNQSEAGQRLRLGRYAQTPVIVEYIYPDGDDSEAASRLEKQVARISALHSEVKSPGFRTMHGLGYVSETLHEVRFGLVYQLPFETTLEQSGDEKYDTLSNAIRKVKHVPLEVRYSLAQALCDATLHLHSIGWWHKALKSDNVILFHERPSLDQEKTSEASLDFKNPYLMGFDCSRPADAETWTATDFNIDNNLYRHPDRWGRPVSFERHHELYALGLLLLEIGCWRAVPTMGSRSKDLRSVRNPETLRSYFLDIVDSRLAHDTGSKYAAVVRKCIEKRDWNTYEDSQYLTLFREQILEPLRNC
ncbi:hypothetical protein F4861DRAFT_504547 [Xylaria intraflava]|nr:hypothetical protein F4861DRAFT_504547 [Xylaria intraflava]